MSRLRLAIVGLLVAATLTFASDLVPVSSRLELGVGRAAEFLTGFYGVDRRDGGLGRWTNGDGTIALPARGRWPADVVVALAGHPTRAGERIEVGTAPGTPVHVESTAAPSGVTVSADEVDPGAPVTIRIVSGTSVTADDARALGVFVYDAWITTGGRRAVSWRWLTMAATWAGVLLAWAAFLVASRLAPASAVVAGTIGAVVVVALVTRLRFELAAHLWWLALVGLTLAVALELLAGDRSIQWLTASPDRRAAGWPERVWARANRVLRSRVTTGMLVSIPAALLVRLLVRHHVDVLYWDQWGMLDFVARGLDGHLTLPELWRQANEHRPFFPRLVLIPLAWATGWSTRVEVVLNVALMTGVLALFGAALSRAWRRGVARRSWIALPLVSLLVYSPSQWENWLWGWQFLVFLQVAAVVAGFACLAGGPLTRGRLVAALALGIVASYSFGGGLVYWGVAPLALVFGPWRTVGVRLGVWLGVAGLTVASYYAGYESISAHPPWSSNFGDWYGLRNFIGFVPTYVGAPLASTDRFVARAVGAAGLVAFAGLGALGLRHPQTRAAALLPVMMGLWVAGCAVLTALGRAPYGQEQALASRYITMSMPFWVGLVMLLVLAPVALPLAAPRHRAALVMATTAALVALAAFAVADWPRGAAAFVRWEERLAPGRQALIDGRNDDAALANLFPSVPHVVEWREVLRRHHLSVFRAPAQPAEPPPGR